MSDLARLMTELISAADNHSVENDMKLMPTLEGQRELLREFARDGDIAMGDEVHRNAQGRLRYKFPTEKQVARILKIYGHVVLDDDGKAVTGELACVVASDGRINVYPVDLRYYEKVTDPG